MEEKKAVKNYTKFPIEAIKYFKTKDLYLLAGLYLCSHYSNNQSYYETDTTIHQLSELTGVDDSYIKNYFLPKLKGSGFIIPCRTIQLEYKVRRDSYTLPKFETNYRVINKELFFDNTLTPDEKGILIALYCLCINNTFRFDLTDKSIWSKLGISKNTLKKYKKLLIEKDILQTSYKAPMALIDLDHTSATIIVYPYLGFKPYTDFIKESKPNDDEIEHYNIILEMDKSECKYVST